MNRPADIAVVLADMPDVVTRLLTDHVADDRGLCRACGTPGTGTPHLRWPCPLWAIAEAARQLRASRLR